MPDLPITAKLSPLKAANWMYLLQAAIITRLITGVVRVVENRPSQQTDPGLTQNKKRQAMMERSYVELFGTALYMLCLHLGQDGMNKYYGRKQWSGNILEDLHHFKAQADELLHQYAGDVKSLDGAAQARLKNLDLHHIVDDTFGNAKGELTQKDLMARVLYGEPVDNRDASGKLIETIERDKATLVTMKKNLIKAYKNQLPKHMLEGDAAKKELADVEKVFVRLLENKHLQEFARKNHWRLFKSFMVGVALSAAVGGSVIQWTNDNLVAAAAKKWLARHYPDGERKPAKKPDVSALSAAVPAHPWASGLSAQAGAFNKPGLDVMSPAFPGNVPMPAFSTVYLPNPKMQPPVNAFTRNALTPYSGLTVFRRGSV